MSELPTAVLEAVAPPSPGDWKDRLDRRIDVNWERFLAASAPGCCTRSERTAYFLDDAIRWLSEAPEHSLQAIVTDPPYGLVEYNEDNLAKKKQGSGGVWRIPPSFDGARRSPVPRFTVLNQYDLTQLHRFFGDFASVALRALAPGGHLFLASNPLVSTTTFHAVQQAGFEKRGEVIRLVQTLRGGDRPKGAERDFTAVSVMPRSCWEPWGVFRKPFAGTVAENLRAWGTGGMRRISNDEPFKDVIACSPTRGREKRIAPHPSLKPQRFLRQVVRASLPLGVGIVCDPFAGSGSTLAAAHAVGYRAIGTDRDVDCFNLAQVAIPRLAALAVEGS